MCQSGACLCACVFQPLVYYCRCVGLAVEQPCKLCGCVHLCRVCCSNNLNLPLLLLLHLHQPSTTACVSHSYARLQRSPCHVQVTCAAETCSCMRLLSHPRLQDSRHAARSTPCLTGILHFIRGLTIGLSRSVLSEKRPMYRLALQCTEGSTTACCSSRPGWCFLGGPGKTGATAKGVVDRLHDLHRAQGDRQCPRWIKSLGRRVRSLAAQQAGRGAGAWRGELCAQVCSFLRSSAGWGWGHTHCARKKPQTGEVSQLFAE